MPIISQDSRILLRFFSSSFIDEDSSCLVFKTGDAGGGQFVLNYSKVFEKLACATLDSMVLEKFGSKALRLFRWVNLLFCVTNVIYLIFLLIIV